MKFHACQLSRQALNLLLAVIIAAGGYLTRPPESVQAGLMSGQASEKLLQFTAGGHVIGFGGQAVYLAGMDHALRVEFAGGRQVQPVAEGKVNGQGGASPLNKVSYNNIWEKIDVTYSASADGIAKSTYVVSPGGDPADISLRYNVPVEIMPGGGLQLQFGNSYMTESAPVAWQEIDGERLPVSVEFQRQEGDRVGFNLGSHDAGHTVYIDPLYQWHTFYGSATGDDQGAAIALDSSGNIYVTGKSNKAWSGPSEHAPIHAYAGTGNNVFVLKLNSAGAYQWHTFYGGATGIGDYATTIALDASNNVVVGGASYNTWGSPLHAKPSDGQWDILVLKLNSAGAYLWHTYYGNTIYPAQDAIQAIALDSSNNVYAVGGSIDTWGTPMHAHSGGGSNNYDMVIMKLNSAGAYQWHTFYGGLGNDLAYGMALDSSANIYLAGSSNNTWGTPMHAHDSTADIADMVVMKLNSAGVYQWHTFYGGAGNDLAYGMDMDSLNNIYLAGASTATWDGPSGQPPFNAFEGPVNMPVLKLNSAGVYQWHTFYGGTGGDRANGIAVNTAGTAIYVTGYSRGSWNGPGPYPPTNPFMGGADLLIMELDGGGAYQYHTYYGSSNNSEEGDGVTVNSAGVVYVAGYTRNWSTCSGQAPLNPYTGGNDILVIAPRSESPPRLLTDNATMAGTSATLNGNVTAINGTSVTERGFVWDTTSRDMPCAVPPASYANYWTESGSYGTGAFTHLLSGLTPNTTYYYRAYARNNSADYAYGVEQPFQTLAEPPVVSTAAADNLTYHSATLNGSLTILGTATPATLSFEYGLTDSYGSTAAGVPASSGSVPQAFSATLDPLSSGTTYHFRAKAVTTDGIGYGDDLTFTTYTSPSVSASAASEVTYQSATLNGNLTSLGSAPSASVSFDYGTSSGSYTLHTAPVSQGSAGAFTAAIGSLSPATTYYWRAVAANEPTYGTSYSTPEQTFLTKTPPAMSTDIASGISGGNVTLNGALTSLGSATNVNVQFGYGTDHAYASKTGWQARTSLGAYNQVLSGLANGTYYYRAEADGGIHGPANGAEKSFTIGGGSASPSATTEPATAIGGSSATLNGNITNMGSAGSINWSFQYGTVSGYYPNETTVTAKGAAGPVSFPLAGLASGTTYYYRAKINAGSAGGEMGAEKSFTTGLTCPTANTDTATSITADGATLNGNLLGFGTATPPVSVSFQYGTTSGVYPNDTAEQAKGTLGTFNASLNGLAASTTYYYRARVDDGTSGGVLGAEKSFRIGNSCPSATTETVTNITSAAGTLQGNLTSLGSASSVNVSFQWGTSPGVYVNETSGTAKTSPVPFSATISGLGLGTTYYYRAKADGGLHGSIFGDEKSFTTGNVPPSVITDTPTSISGSGTTVNGVLTSLGSAPGAEVSFQWGTASGSYPNQTPESSKDSPGTFNRPLSGLSNITTYYYRAKVDRDPHGGAFGDELAFLTGSTCPTGTTQTATGITADGATLNGNLLTLGSASSVNGCFQWGIASGVYDHQTDLHMMSSPAPFTFGLTGLAGGATCYYRAKIDGGIYGSVFGAEKSFTAGSTCPTIYTDTPTTITASSVQLNGILTTAGSAAFPVNVSFQWGTAAGVYPNETTQQPVTAAGTFNANVSGLSSGTLYYYRAKVDDGTSGGAFGEEHSFRAGATCPTATTQTATAISTTGATLNGNLLTLGSASSVNVMFQWGISPTVYVNETSPAAMASGAPFAADLTGLSDGTTYYYRSKVDGGVNGSVFGIEKSFTTGSTNPTVITDGASTITPAGATLNGILTSLGTAPDVNVSFQWGTVSGVYPNETVPGNKSSIGTFQATLSSLTSGTLYYYRSKVDDGTSGGVFGLERSFRAGATCPSATTQTATDITTTTAILQGNLLSKGSATVVDVCFQWGIAPGAFTDWTPFQAMGSPAPFITTLTGLTNGATCYYRVRADGGSNGTAYGDEKSFTAGSTNPGIITDVPTLITASHATLNGVLTDMGTATSVNLSFQWGDTSGVYPNETTPQAISSAMTFSDNITGLTGGTTYFYRAKVDDGTSGGAFGIERAFRTGTNSPNITTEPATSVSTVAATLNANLISLRDAPSCNITFQWGIASGACIYETVAIARTSPGIVSCNVTGLTPGATYYFRAKADSGLYGGTLGIEKMFITSARQPVVSTETAFVAIDSAQLNGNLASLGDAAGCNLTFKWGTISGIYAYETSPQYVDHTTSFSDNIGNLLSDTTYYYRAKADTVRYGGFFGAEKSFTTSGKNSTTQSSTNKGTVSFSSDAGNLVDLTALKPGDSDCHLDSNQFRYGLFSFKIINLKPGAVSTVTLNLPDNMPGNTKYYKCINMKKVDCTSLLGHNDGDKTLTLRLTDGGLGDADGRANGIIVDPGGPVTIDTLIGAGTRSSAQSPSIAPAVINKDPVALSNIRVQAASISLSDVAMGESVEVTAQVSNNGNADGTKLVNIYLNGDHVSSQLVSLEKGKSKPVTFTVSVPSPGIYNVQVDNVDAGSFNVSLFKLKDGLWVLGLSLILISLLGLLVIIWRRRQSYY